MVDDFDFLIVNCPFYCSNFSGPHSKCLYLESIRNLVYSYSRSIDCRLVSSIKKYESLCPELALGIRTCDDKMKKNTVGTVQQSNIKIIKKQTRYQ